jgi:hypothetical protein
MKRLWWRHFNRVSSGELALTVSNTSSCMVQVCVFRCPFVSLVRGFPSALIVTLCVRACVRVPDGPPTPQQHLGLPDLPNVALTPHVAAYSADAMAQVGREGVTNLVMALKGVLPPTEKIVNPPVVPLWRQRFGEHASL